MPPKFVPRERKHRRLAKLKEQNSSSKAPIQSNAETIIPSEQEQRRQELKNELRAHQPDVKISGKKRKRLDHYVDTKLRKEENLELIKKLASHQIDTTLLQSSKKLGRVNDTRRETIERALRERNAGIDVHGNQEDILFQRRDAPATASIQVAVPTEKSSDAATESFGSGLKRPLDVGDDGRPTLPTRKRRKREKKARSTVIREETPVSDEEGLDTDEAMNSATDEEEWNGFSDGDIEDPSTEESRQGTTSDSDEGDSATSESEDESQGGSEDESEDDDDENTVDKPARASAFKMWAAARRNDAIGFEPSIAPTTDPAVRAAFKPRELSPDSARPVATTTETTARPEKAITISRAPDIQAARLELPVVREEQKIMEAIHNNPITIVCGETGSGKTTQVPQMLYEAGYGISIGKPRAASEKSASFGRGMIGITQPRRVAAVSVAQRVKMEMGDFSKHVAHQVRYDSSVSNDTAMKFMTDGILLREISQDFVLSKYSAIVIDEAHERSVNTDILIGMLSRIVPLRTQLTEEQPTRYSPLKLIIMSATLRVSDFIQNDRLFKGVVPPIVEAEGRQHPVTIHFSRTTERDFVSEMVRKVERAHRKLPHGGMLVFLTGQQEIQDVAARLSQVLGGQGSGYTRPAATKGRDSSFGFGADDYDNATIQKKRDTLEGEDDAGSDVEVNGADSDAEDADFDVPADPAFTPAKAQGLLKPLILPLYAALPTAQQMRVFQPPPDGHRLIVLATNVAETSLTIPGIRYVFDCGRSKEKVYDTSAGPGIQTFEIDWISKASAAQRAGRAGRTGPGHCYRLYSSAVFEEFFAQHGVPEILRTPLENVVLQLKSMEIETVVNFPFPTPPERKQLEVAETLLRNLGAIEEGSGKITPLGRQLLAFPVSPRFGKILLLAQANEVVTPAVATVAALAVGDLSIPEVQAGAASAHAADDESDDYDGNQRRRMEREIYTAAQELHMKYTRAQAKLSHWDDRSDAVKMLATVAVHADAMLKKTSSQICKDFYLHEKPLQEAQQLRQQLHNIIASQLPAGTDTAKISDLSFQPSIPIPSEKRSKMLNQVIAAGFVDQIAIRADLLGPSTGLRAKRANQVAYRTLVPSVNEADIDRALSPEDQDFQRSVYVHSASVLAKLSPTEMPPYVVYSHLSRASIKSLDDNDMRTRTRMHPLCVISAKQIAALAEGTPLLQYGKPIQKIEEFEGGRRRCWVSIELSATTGGLGWSLGAWRVEQKRGPRGDWVVDKVLQR